MKMASGFQLRMFRVRACVRACVRASGSS